jgi:hypothetical protein
MRTPSSFVEKADVWGRTSQLHARDRMRRFWSFKVQMEDSLFVVRDSSTKFA